MPCSSLPGLHTLASAPHQPTEKMPSLHFCLVSSDTQRYLSVVHKAHPRKGGKGWGREGGCIWVFLHAWWWWWVPVCRIAVSFVFTRVSTPNGGCTPFRLPHPGWLAQGLIWQEASLLIDKYTFIFMLFYITNFKVLSSSKSQSIKILAGVLLNIHILLRQNLQFYNISDCLSRPSVQ